MRIIAPHPTKGPNTMSLHKFACPCCGEALAIETPKSIDRDSVLEEAAKACAQVIADSDKNMDHELGTGFDLGCEECANAIRSLKDTP